MPNGKQSTFQELMILKWIEETEYNAIMNESRDTKIKHIYNTDF